MHLEPLSKTSVEILAYLSSKLRESFTVRQIAGGIGQDYRITYVMTMRLARQKYIIAEKRRPVTHCRLNLKGNSALLAYIEAIRAGRFLAKHRDIEVIANGLLEKIASPFFTMILFGSHLKGTASKRSDLDVLVVIPRKDMERDVSSAVGSVARISPVGIHEVILTNEEFAQLLRENKPNVAWEALDNRIVPFGAEPLFKILEDVT
jgi:predicted nucleotidyltransferase